MLHVSSLVLSIDVAHTQSGFSTGAVTDFAKEKNPHNVSGLLKMFFREFPNPLLTFELGPELLKAADIPDEDAQLEALKKVWKLVPGMDLVFCSLYACLFLFFWNIFFFMLPFISRFRQCVFLSVALLLVCFFLPFSSSKGVHVWCRV